MGDYYFNDLIINVLDKLKNEQGLEIKTIAEEMNVNPKNLYTIRNYGKKAKELDFKKLLEKYPQTEPEENTVNDSMILVSDGRAWKELAETQRKLLGALEHRLAKAEEENRELRVEVRLLRERCLELEKKNG